MAEEIILARQFLTKIFGSLTAPLPFGANSRLRQPAR
jgi:hypothetical protein